MFYSLTGNTCYYEMANEHVNSGTEKEQLNNYEQEGEKPKKNISVGSEYRQC